MSFLLLPFHEVIYHYVFRRHGVIGWELLFPEQMFLVALAICFRRSIASAISAWRFEIGLLAINAVAFWASAVANAARSQYALQVFVVGSLLPVVFVLLLSAATSEFGFDPVRDGLFYLLASVGVVCVIGLLAYPVSFGIPRDFHEFIYDIRTDRALLGSRHGYWYGDLTLGNFNVFASCLLPSLMLGYGWFHSEGARPRVRTILWSGWCAVIAVNLYICYSRGSFLVLNVCAVLLGVFLFHRREAHGNLVRAAVVLVAFDLLIIAPPGAISYWRSLGERSPSNSAAQRIGQWEEVAAGPIEGRASVEEGLPPRKPGPTIAPGRLRYLLFGVGVGNYGKSRDLGVDANTHNLFLNQFVVGGLPGILSFAVLFGLVVFRGLRNVLRRTDALAALRLSGLVGLVAIALMGVLSQYEFANLGTMTGGLLFWTCAFFSRLDSRGVVS